GHTNILINGLPHEGDHYDFGHQLIPLKLKKGNNKFLLTGGRFSRIRARLIAPEKAVQLTQRDLTLPDLLAESQSEFLGAIRVINADSKSFSGGTISCQINGTTIKMKLPEIAPMTVRKVPFKIAPPKKMEAGESLTAKLTLSNSKSKTIDEDQINLDVKSEYKHHKRTFLSTIDGSVQYYSMAPSTNQMQDNPALFLSVHGASVEAVNQARAYKQKDWGHIIAPTNRRPFGFAWEDWGRLDALEVLADAEQLLGTDPQRTYLTGHSMGGHGTWYLGATYPDRFAAIAPCAGYPDLLAYRQSFTRRMLSRSDEELANFGWTRAGIKAMAKGPQFDRLEQKAMDEIIRRAGNPSRTLKLIQNYLHLGVYVLHGEDDTVVPTFLARDMRSRLGQFHNDFTYYEYPNGTHWYGDHSMDWPPIFDFFKARSIASPETLEEIEFSTASPGVSAKSHFITIVQQEMPLEISNFHFVRTSEAISLKTDNVKRLRIDLTAMGSPDTSFTIDDQTFEIKGKTGPFHLLLEGKKWRETEPLETKEKGPHRNGGFKDAFRNQFVLVYATSGNDQENEWYYNRAKFDAEKFWYRANGNVELVADHAFQATQYRDQNVILYGNEDNNKVWDQLLVNCPISVRNGSFKIGNRTLSGDQWGAYFIYPRSDSDFASVGVVTASGIKGMKAAYANDYLVNGTTFPDVMIFDHKMMQKGLEGIAASGFFGNDWSVKNGDFVWR
ncbi:MAG: alpha/beta hydrolase, partial [Bacteroidota bacterium]